MESSLSLIVALCLASGLWIEAEARPDEEMCPSGWSQYGCSCFKFFGGGKRWADAELDCIKQGGNLASIHSDAEHQFVRDLIRSSSGGNKRTYVGGHDLHKEGLWAWSDGSKFSFPGWHKGEPNNHGRGEDCMELNFHYGGNDIPCNLARPYVCSKPV
ncbi:galactose-specific lectin nattectin-like [Synchiropus splendidus]|uniref:galactose-specific lectin nattectin-like n=1 Tax=Synchiropus splendidus TaxID=270530 RepID=UPI00237D745A|nr:galactose-specific lectin nattectin-like [Synchiropus splendidus]